MSIQVNKRYGGLLLGAYALLLGAYAQVGDALIFTAHSLWACAIVRGCRRTKTIKR